MTLTRRNIAGVPGRRDRNPRLMAFARSMRKTPTDAEKKLWSLLRRGKVDGFHFRRQVPVAGYIVDFCCLSAGIGVEPDGGEHYTVEAKQCDQQRSDLRAEGIRILRFSDDDILKYPDAVQKTIYRELTVRPPSATLPRSRVPIRGTPRMGALTGGGKEG